MRKTKGSQSAIYMAAFLDEPGNLYVKIGKANAPIQRLAGIQVGCPFELQSFSYIILPTEALAYRAERQSQAALKKYHLRGEWFIARSGDESARIALGCVPAEVTAALVKRPVRVHTLSMAGYEAARKLMQATFGNPLERKAGRTRSAA